MRNRILKLFMLGFILTSCAMPEGPVSLSGEVPEAEGWDTEVVLSGLEHPWSMVWVPDGEMLITERPGRLRLVRDGELDPQPILGLPEIYTSGQGGLLDISLHPDFENNNLIYLTYSTGNEDANRTTVGRGVYQDHELVDFEEIFRVSHDKNDDQHFGSRIEWLPDGTFLLTLADGGNYVRFDGGWIREQAQNPGTHLGKVLRLTKMERLLRIIHLLMMIDIYRKSGHWVTEIFKALPVKKNQAEFGQTNTVHVVETS